MAKEIEEEYREIKKKILKRNRKKKWYMKCCILWGGGLVGEAAGDLERDPLVSVSCVVYGERGIIVILTGRI